MKKLIKKLKDKFFKKKEIEFDYYSTLLAINNIDTERGLLWEQIEKFKEALYDVPNHAVHHTKEMEELMPLKHHIEGGLYTREIFMPKGTIVVSFIHKTNHPSFMLKGEVSVLTDDGKVERIKAPYKIMTKEGTQRVLYIHEDTTWCCVYRTDAVIVEEAEKEVYTEDFRELPEYLIKHKQLTDYSSYSIK